ncbi:MAG: type II toxin-antitoxin system HicA family toxin [Chloroflexi bacterium]|nr:type II toxin-antitoxin system HicA family toxin [Chloroflexota bacterium]MBP7042267.1 type II toxin-antitoxin system HicA family toxin [Chloroflexota bacterium]
MPPLPLLTARQVVAALHQAGFESVRQKGSHIRLRHPDGRVVTVPDHLGQNSGRGLLRKILRDADLSRDEFVALLK